MRIIEFCALPGSGKTTVCDKLIEVLSPASKIYSRKDIFNNCKANRSVKLFRNVRAFAICCNPFSELNRAVFSFAGQYSKIWKNGFVRYYAYVTVLYANLCKIDKDENALVILDEGFIQFLTHFAFRSKNYVKQDDKLKKIASTISSRLTVEFIVGDADIDSIIQRKQKMNQWPEDHLIRKELLTKRKADMKTVLELFCSDCHTLDMNGSLDRVYCNALRIIQND